MSRIYISPSNQNNNPYSYGGTNEMEQCYKIGQACNTALKRCGFTTMLADKGQAMNTSIAESNNFDADVHICIHTNAGGGKGTEVFVYNTASGNMKYAQPVYNELVALTGKGRGIKVRSELAEINGTTAVCVYCECEFHDNANLAKWIVENTTVIGEAIAKGVCKGFGVTYKSAYTKPILDPKGWTKGDWESGIFAVKQMLDMAKSLKIITQGVDTSNGCFGDGTHIAVNQVLKLGGYAETGIVANGFIKLLTTLIRNKAGI